MTFFKLAILLFFVFPVKSFGQTGIGTTSPDLSAILDVKSSSKGVLFPRVSLTGTLDATTIPNPAVGLIVFNIANAGSGDNAVFSGSYYHWTGVEWSILFSASNLDVVKVPKTAVFTLSSNQPNFLESQSSGNAQTVAPMSEIVNNIEGLTFNPNTSLITLPKGTYQLTVVYEALHDATGCNLSSYFVDFPGDPTPIRIHSTASHNGGSTSNHGGTITYTVVLSTNTYSWTINLGRGQSGNCSGSGMTLIAKSTQIVITQFD